jgi:hypothetical protein
MPRRHSPSPTFFRPPKSSSLMPLSLLFIANFPSNPSLLFFHKNETIVRLAVFDN